MKIFYDVDTQRDFMHTNGALYVPGSGKIESNLEELTNFARIERIPIWGSMDRHFENDPELKRNGGPFPDHCMNGATGQKLVAETNYDVIDVDMGYATKVIPHKVSENQTYDWNPQRLFGVVRLFQAASVMNYMRGVKILIQRGPNIIFEKQANDVFTNPAAEKLMRALEVKEAVVYGVATDYCVKDAVLGMQKRGIQCYVVKDAIAAVTTKTGKAALEKMVKAGAKLVKTKDVLKNMMKWDLPDYTTWLSKEKEREPDKSGLVEWFETK
ncbi:cysteine hydrolase [Candidatus Woesearchaeota archaeon]|nr:cysteine hydrolase [Candidatus Woesearchaeota archaeon]